MKTRTKPKAMDRSWLAAFGLFAGVASIRCQPLSVEGREAAVTVDGRGQAGSSPGASLSASTLEGSAREATLRRYPPGRWRLTSLVELDSVSVHLSHLVVRHAGITSRQAGLTPATWYLDYPASQRSRAEAIRLAAELRSRAQRGEDFATLARRYSEDPSTSAAGGSLGCQAAAQLSLWPEVLDAIAAEAPGQVSLPVELPDGIHLFLQRAPREAQLVSGRRLVVGHDDAPWLQYNARGSLVPRSRERAHGIAAPLARELRLHPDRFAAAVEEHSEHVDALRGGDLGTWSTGEPSLSWREVEALSALQVGEVSEPIETIFGVEVLQRTPATARQAYGFRALHFPFNPEAAPSEPHSRGDALAAASRTSQALSDNPEGFDVRATTRCCAESVRLVEGRDWAPLEAALKAIPTGAVVAQPVLGSASDYLVVQRVAAPEPAAIRSGLPRPKRADLAYFVQEDGPLTQRALQAVRRRLTTLEPKGAANAPLRAALEGLGDVAAQPAPERLQRMQRLQKAVEGVPGKGFRERFVEILYEEFEREILQDRGT